MPVPLPRRPTGTMNVSVRRMPNLYGLFATITGHNHLSLALTAAVCVALLAWAAFRRPSLPLALLVSVGTGLYLFPCDLALLLLPISLLCNRVFAEDDARDASPAMPGPQPARLSWLQKHRREILFCALGVFLISPALIEIIVNNLIFLLALPILALAFCRATGRA